MLLPLKFAAAAAVAGAVLLMLGTALHPLEADPADAAAAFAEYAGDDLWVASHLGQFLGVVLIFIGLVGLSDSLRGQTAEWVTRLGIFFGVAAVATAAVLQAVDGVALKVMVDTWAKSEAEKKQIAFQGAMAVRQIEVGLASFSALLFGTVFVLFGSAVALSETYPNWLGWFGLIGGIGTIAGGLTTAAAGFSNIAMIIAMSFNVILVIWMAVLGLLMWRRTG